MNLDSNWPGYIFHFDRNLPGFSSASCNWPRYFKTRFINSNVLLPNYSLWNDLNCDFTRYHMILSSLVYVLYYYRVKISNHPTTVVCEFPSSSPLTWLPSVIALSHNVSKLPCFSYQNLSIQQTSCRSSHYPISCLNQLPSCKYY